MPRLTAIEFSDDTCVLVRVVAHGASVEVTGVEVLDPAAFPGNTFTRALRGMRRTGGFPRRARVVLWGLPDGASARDPAVKPLLSPLEDAGFRVERVVSPCNALAALARIREPRHDGAVIWLAIDRAAVAVVAARPGELLYSHAFAWDSSIGAIGSQARLLQRYTLVAFLTPEIRRAIEAVAKHGVAVETVITCGSLADLRSLTMPLIDELDVEVETLDSLAGLTVAGSLMDRVTDLAPAIRLACAGAFTRPSRPRRPLETAPRGASWLRIAALIILALAAVIAAAYFLPRWWRSAPTTSVQQSQSRRESPATASPALEPLPQIREREPAEAPRRNSSPDSGSTTRQRPPQQPQPVPQAPPGPQVESEPAVQSREPAGSSTSAVPALPSISKPPLYAAGSPADNPTETLKDPLPNVTTILVSANRRFAIVDGRIVGVGDRVGKRTVAAIEPHVVVFQEPSGTQVRVGLGGRRVLN